jgi:hypothetical protein
VFANYSMDDPNNRTAPHTLIGLSDEGAIRYIDLAAGSLRDGAHPSLASVPPQQRIAPFGRGPIVYELPVLYHALDMLRLVARLAADHGYTGSWLLGISLVNMKDRRSSVSGAISESDELSATGRATTADLRARPDEVAAALLRPIFRDLGAENAMDAKFADRAAAR